jgi:hypothetical protein
MQAASDRWLFGIFIRTMRATTAQLSCGQVRGHGGETTL